MNTIANFFLSLLPTVPLLPAPRISKAKAPTRLVYADVWSVGEDGKYHVSDKPRLFNSFKAYESFANRIRAEDSGKPNRRLVMPTTTPHNTVAARIRAERAAQEAQNRGHDGN
jgi:hypothetical protein